MSIASWILLPLTAHAILNPAPTSTQKVPLLGEESSYTVDYPIDSQNALYVSQTNFDTSTSSDTEISTSSPINDSDAIKAKIKEYFPDNWRTMYQIAAHESGDGITPKLDAYNPENHDHVCNGSYGAFQIGCNNYSGDPKDLYDLDTNVRMAKEVFDKQNYGAWGVCLKKIVVC